MEIIADSVVVSEWMVPEYKHCKRMFVYSIRCKANGKCYIGSTENIKSRLRHHAGALRSGKHYNKLLQADFNKFGEENFEARVLTTTDDCRPHALAMEKNWIKKTQSFKPEHGYNNDVVSKILRGEDPFEYRHVKA